ncbi:hypothetical protein HanRHA438_Chr05g0240731 [Helianthus annuus]|nr:hypothetical protein HanRHA438_Chr05g0240731 [Helianthus annuus]
MAINNVSRILTRFNLVLLMYGLIHLSLHNVFFFFKLRLITLYKTKDLKANCCN